MKVILALALAAPVSADYISETVYAASDTCQGSVFAISAYSIGCETTSGDTSVRIKCDGDDSNSSYIGASVETFLNANCSGSPFDSEDFPLSFGCQSTVPGSSVDMRCAMGDFVAPTPAANQYVYNGEDSCPPSADGDLTSVYSYPCGTCMNAYGTFLSYSCDATELTLSYFLDPGCSGDPLYSYPPFETCGATTTPCIITLGCDAHTHYTSWDQVTVSRCDNGEDKKAKAVAAVQSAVPDKVKAAIAAAKAAKEAGLKAAAAAKDLLEATLLKAKEMKAQKFRTAVVGATTTCTGPGEFCCPAPSDDVNNCPDSARSNDCDKLADCCCG